MITDILQTGTIPNHMNTALITLILKPKKDPLQCSIYQPLSLINTDLKIISKALAMRLDIVIPTLIHLDQTGFIKGRHANDNLRRLFNIIQLSNDTTFIYCPSSLCIIASLDAEKVFDKVRWPFLFASLKQFGFGEYYSNWIKLLYKSPTASVVTNGLISKPSNLLQGTMCMV